MRDKTKIQFLERYAPEFKSSHPEKWNEIEANGATMFKDPYNWAGFLCFGQKNP